MADNFQILHHKFNYLISCTGDLGVIAALKTKVKRLKHIHTLIQCSPPSTFSCCSQGAAKVNSVQAPYDTFAYSRCVLAKQSPRGETKATVLKNGLSPLFVLCRGRC